MNSLRRNRIAAIAGQLHDLKAALEEVQQQEQEAFDAIPENLLGTEMAEKSESAIDTISGAVADLETMIESLTEL